MKDKDILITHDNKNVIKSKKNDNFFELQIKYKQSVENILSKLIDFKKIDQYMQNLDYIVPIVPDSDYNLYRKYSILGSKYIYMKNNIHIEKLNDDEVDIINKSILNKQFLDINFISKTLGRALFEKGDFTFYDIPVLERKVKSKSIVFEFAFDQIECKSVKQINDITKTFEEIFESMKKSFMKANLPVSMIVYNSIPDIYRVEEKVEQSNISDMIK